MRRWLIRLLLAAVVLAALVGGGVQAVLWSDLPRRIVADQLAKQTGLVVELDALRTGWSGQTRLEGLTLRLPLADKPLAELPSARLKHTGLMPLVLGQGFAIERLEATGPALSVRQLDDGQWNLARLARTIAANQPEPAAPAGPPPALPEVAIENARVTVQREGQMVAIPAADIRLTNAAPGTCALDANVQGLGRITGRVARQAPYNHRLAVRLNPTGPWLGQLLGKTSAERLARLDTRARWHGAAAPGGVQGQIRIHRLFEGQAQPSLAGDLTLHYENGRLQVRPRGLTLSHPNLPEPVVLTAGRASYAEGVARLTRLTAHTLGGQVRLDGQFEADDMTGELAVDWAGLDYPKGLAHAGAFTVDVNRGQPGRRAINGKLTIDGKKSPAGPWQSRLSFNLAGPDWNQLDGTVRLDQLRIERPDRPLTVHGLTMGLAIQPKAVSLTELQLAGQGQGQADRLTSTGRYAWATGQWSFDFDGRNLNLTGLPTVERLDLELEGQDSTFELQPSELVVSGLELKAEGSYHPNEPEWKKPFKGRLTLDQLPLRLREATRSLVEADNLRGGIEVTGSIRPLRLDGTGTLTAKNLRAGEEQLGDIDLAVKAGANEDAITLETQELNVLDSTWRIDGRYNFSREARADAGQRYAVEVKGSSLDLNRLYRAMGGGSLLKGRGQLTLRADGDGLALEQLNVNGQFAGRRIGIGPIAIHTLDGKLSIQNGILRLQRLTAEHPRQGKLTGHARLPLNQPSRVSFDLDISPWSLLPGQAVALTVGGQLKGTFNAAQRTGDVTGQLATTLASERKTLVSLQSPLAIEQNDDGQHTDRLRLKNITGTMLGGQATGDATFHLRSPLASTMTLNWQNSQPTQLGGLVPPFNKTRGALNGSLVVKQPTDEAHPRGQLRARLKLNPTDQAGYGPISIGQTTATAYYVNEKRLLLDNLVTHVAGGKMTLWSRLTRHPAPPTPDKPDAPAHQWHLFASGTVDKLNLEPLVKTFVTEQKRVLGKLDIPEANLVTELTLDGSAKHNLKQILRQLHGQGKVAITQSDLVDVPIVGLFYDLLNLNIGEKAPEGTGRTTFRFEGGRLIFENLQYENRGMNLRILGLEVEDLTTAGRSPVQGYALAALNPLPDIQAFEMINQAFATLQTDVTTVQISGTLAEPEPKPIILANFGSALGTLLGTDDNEGGQTATEAEKGENELEAYRKKERARQQQAPSDSTSNAP